MARARRSLGAADGPRWPPGGLQPRLCSLGTAQRGKEEQVTRARRLEGASQRCERGCAAVKFRRATSPLVPERASRRLIQGLHDQHRYGAWALHAAGWSPARHSSPQPA
jgi:hypothetical protein